jgi:hemoglobin
MAEPVLPSGLVEARYSPLFDLGSLPELLGESHRTTVWAELFVQKGSVRYIDLEGELQRDEVIDAGQSAVIVPGGEHRLEPSTDAEFFVQFYREPDAATFPLPAESARHSGAWELRGRDLDSRDEILEMVTRQCADIVQDELLGPYFDFGAGHIDWKAHIGAVTDFWCHVLLYAPDYEIDVIEQHRSLHQHAPFGPDLFDRWLDVFRATVDGGWVDPNAEPSQEAGNRNRVGDGAAVPR